MDNETVKQFINSGKGASVVGSIISTISDYVLSRRNEISRAEYAAVTLYHEIEESRYWFIQTDCVLIDMEVYKRKTGIAKLLDFKKEEFYLYDQYTNVLIAQKGTMVMGITEEAFLKEQQLLSESGIVVSDGKNKNIGSEIKVRFIEKIRFPSPTKEVVPADYIRQGNRTEPSKTPVDNTPKNSLDPNSKYNVAK